MFRLICGRNILEDTVVFLSYALQQKDQPIYLAKELYLNQHRRATAHPAVLRIFVTIDVRILILS